MIDNLNLNSYNLYVNTANYYTVVFPPATLPENLTPKEGTKRILVNTTTTTTDLSQSVLPLLSPKCERGGRQTARALARLRLSGTDRPSLSIYKSKRSGAARGNVLTSSPSFLLAPPTDTSFKAFLDRRCSYAHFQYDPPLPPNPAREKDCFRAISLESCHKNVIH